MRFEISLLWLTHYGIGQFDRPCGHQRAGLFQMCVFNFYVRGHIHKRMAIITMSVSYEYISNIFYNRVGMTYFKLGAYHYLVAGRQDDSAGTPGTCKNDIWRSSDCKSWECIQDDAAFDPRAYCVGVVYNGYMYLIGGLNQAVTSNFYDVWKSNDGITWTLCTDTPGWSPPMHAMNAVVIANKMFVLGGNNAPSGPGWGYAIFSSTDGETWTHESDGAFGGHEYSALQVIGTTAYLYGGKKTGSVMSGDCWSSPDGVNWTLIAASAFAAHYGERGCVCDGKLYAICGRVSMDAIPPSLLNQGFCSSDGITWTELPIDLNYIGYHCLAVQDNKIYILGGYYNGISRIDINYVVPAPVLEGVGGILF